MIEITRIRTIAVMVALLAVASSWAGLTPANESAGPSPAPKAARGETKPKVACASLDGWKIPASSIRLPTSGASIVSAKVIPAFTPLDTPLDFVPEYCEINGIIAPVDPKAPNIDFQVVLPTVWNGKSWQIGGNQQSGFIPLLAALARDNSGSPIGPVEPPDATFPIARGYALYGDDTGHCCAQRPGRRGPGGTPGPPANHGRFLNVPHNFGPPTPDWETNAEALENLGNAHIKKTHDVAMAVIVKIYGVRPRINYFSGESMGGREAMMAATRFPEDYDGVTSSVPSIYNGINMFRQALRLRAQAAPGGWIPPSKVPAIAKESRRQCDALDGLEDGVISNYIACNKLFDPATHPDAYAKIRCPGGADTGDDCLSDAQIRTVNSFHADFKFPFTFANGEDTLTGSPLGFEDNKGRVSPWIIAAKQPDQATLKAASKAFQVAFSAPDFDLTAPDLNALILEHKDAIIHYASVRDVNPDLSKFFAKGGKLIMHTSADDPVENPRAQMRFFEEVVAKNGRKAVDKSMRYYVTPNADHSTAGYAYGNGEELPRQWDALTYIENWVEKGQAPPEPMIEMLKDIDPPYTLRRSRPLCRYPDYPRYNGSGDPKVASSYTCTAP